MKTCDFSRSFFTFQIDLEKRPPRTLSHRPPYSYNNARIPIECRCELLERATERRNSYVLGASCKSEQVGAERDLFTEPNADMCAVTSLEEFLILKSWKDSRTGVMLYPPSLGRQPQRQIGLVQEAWSDFRIDLRRVDGRELKMSVEIVQAVLQNAPLTARTEYDDGDYHVCLEYPVKTINANDRDDIYQTDTGPIIVPDLSPQRVRSAERLVGVFDLAYSAFNAPDWIEFVINEPTAVTEEISVNHYSRRRRVDNVRNTVIAILY